VPQDSRGEWFAGFPKKVREKREKRQKVHLSVTAACRARVEVDAALPGFMAEICRFGGAA
jgi:transposase